MVFIRGGCVDMMTNKYNAVIYTGVTSNLYTRIFEHKNAIYSNSFTVKYNCKKLVYYCFYSTIEEAISEEKRIKGCSKEHKRNLVQLLNPEWRDLYDELLEQ